MFLLFFSKQGCKRKWPPAEQSEVTPTSGVIRRWREKITLTDACTRKSCMRPNKKDWHGALVLELPQATKSSYVWYHRQQPLCSQANTLYSKESLSFCSKSWKVMLPHVQWCSVGSFTRKLDGHPDVFSWMGVVNHQPSTSNLVLSFNLPCLFSLGLHARFSGRTVCSGAIGSHFPVFYVRLLLCFE